MRVLRRTEMAKKYPGKWVALKADRTTVVGSGSSVRQAMKAAKLKGVDCPVITRMPLRVRGFIGGLP